MRWAAGSPPPVSPCCSRPVPNPGRAIGEDVEFIHALALAEKTDNGTALEAPRSGLKSSHGRSATGAARISRFPHKYGPTNLQPALPLPSCASHPTADVRDHLSRSFTGASAAPSRRNPTGSHPACIGLGSLPAPESAHRASAQSTPRTPHAGLPTLTTPARLSCRS